MKNRFVFPLAVLFLGCGVLNAQTSNHRNPAMVSEPRPQTLASGKTTNHESTPSLCYIFDWMANGSSWDSTWMNTMTYSPDGLETERIIYQYMQGTGFVPSARITVSHDAQNRSDTITNYAGAPNQWIPSFKLAYHFDAIGNLDQMLIYQYANGWDTNVVERTRYTYTFTNRIAGQTRYEYNMNSQNWDSVYKEVNHFPNANGWDSSYTYLWNGSSWDPNQRKIATWHDFDKDLPLTLVNADYIGQAYVNTYRIRGQYPSSQNIIYVNDEWNGQSWDSLNKETYAYDSYDHDTLYESFDWQGNWVKTSGFRSIYTYSVDGDAIDKIEQNFDGSNYVNSSRVTCPEFFVTNADEASNLSHLVTAFPNPCTEKLNLQVNLTKGGPAAFILMDAQGRTLLVSQMVVPAGETLIPIHLPQQLANGIYTYSLLTKEGKASGKVMVQR